ncbi:uncharacterized protein LACBIDRAFT_325497 [Laccaria bicolor S238N-H82]|uniref:Predicted protein n=1 Tax=Laccaria bicolor (strain S238N-H82 / ATCC MYA-4686) TaxID=486041 RepID=B0D549_LACBS|nr:uncharacterized protein LACBIDRAFT_325497 [Laccaria bicolor S238N-H82]EDR10675.1 predicted protein [Laccaria bicolor S238N-H82]|eukprot:XP_001879125.1 predicted protein [Laccaria bicolor S238N-H82]
MEPDILGALSVTSGNDWDLPAIPLSCKDIDLSCFAVDGGIIDPDLDTLGFYKNGQLDMDQVNHHVHLALDHLRRYDNKGNQNRHVYDSSGEPGPSRNGRHAPIFNPFNALKKSSAIIPPMAPIEPTTTNVPSAVAAVATQP